jgi:hypothetical protein
LAPSDQLNTSDALADPEETAKTAAARDTERRADTMGVLD